MKSNKQNKHLGYIQKAFATIKEKNKPLNPMTVMSDGMIECSNGSKRYVISGAEAVATFRGLTSNIQSQPEWHGKFSEKYISTELRKILAGLSVGAPETLDSRLEDFMKSLQEFNEVRELVTPIQGLKLEVEAFRLGGVTFRPTDQSQINQLKWRAEQTIESLKHADEDKAYFREHYRKVIEERLGAFDALAFSETVAEADQARINALQNINMALNVLRFLTPYTQELPEYVGLGLPGHFTAAAYSSIVFSEDGSFNTDFPLAGRFLPFKVDHQFLQRHRESLESLSEIIVSPSRSELEERILVAIQWAGRAHSDSQPQQQVLSLMTALECLLNPTNGKPLRIGVSESAVFLVGSEDLEERLKLFQFLGSMYDARSSIIHGGSAEPSNSDIANLQRVVGAVIKRVVGIRHKYATRKALEAHLERARLSAKADL
jgi:hypothetical protein